MKTYGKGQNFVGNSLELVLPFNICIFGTHWGEGYNSIPLRIEEL